MGTVQDVVTIGGLVFNSPDAWYRKVDVMEGWESTAPLVFATTPNGNGPGALLAAYPVADQKAMTVGGAWLAETREAAEAARTQLLELFPVGREVAIDRAGVRRYAYLSDMLDVDLATPRGFRWSAPLISLDPFRYALDPVTGFGGISTGDPAFRTYDAAYVRRYDPDGWTRTYEGGGSSGVRLDSGGDADSARVVVEVTGPLVAGDWRIVNDATGDITRPDLSLTSAQTLVLDSAAQLATVGGADATSYIYGAWPRLAPGRNTFRLLSGTPNQQAVLRVTATPAWR